MAGNLIVGGLVGLATDASTGATLDHVPNPVRFTLKPVGGRAKFIRRRPASNKAAKTS